MTQSQVRFTGDQNGPSIRPSVRRVCVCPKMHSELYKINFTKFFVKLISRKNLQCKNPVFRNNQKREISNQILIFKEYEIELTSVKWVKTQVESYLNNFFIFISNLSVRQPLPLLLNFHLTVRVHRKQMQESPKYPYKNQNVLSICHNCKNGNFQKIFSSSNFLIIFCPLECHNSYTYKVKLH